MTNFQAIFKRLYKSAVVWSWAVNGLRLASGILLLPIIIKLLPTADLGMYYVFLSLGGLALVLDFGFATGIGRSVSYAMGGASELKPMGFVTSEKDSQPNHALLGDLLHATQNLYRYLAVAGVILLGTFGTAMVSLRAGETTHPTLTWCAWSVTVLAAAWEIYAGWWNTFLRSMNQVQQSMQQAFAAQLVKLLLAVGLLFFGGGLLSLPTASLISSLLQRNLARSACLRLLPEEALKRHATNVAGLLRILWPNTWRLGLQFLSGYLTTNTNMLICSKVYSLDASAQYGLSIQIMSICAGMATVWISVKWPAIGQLRTQGDYTSLQRMLWPRVWLQSLTFFLFAGLAVTATPFLLHWIGSGKTVLPMPWLGLLALTFFLEMNYSFWGTLISTENRMPFVLPIIITNVCNLLLVLALVRFTSLGLAAFVLAPLVVGSLLNFWYWPMAGAKNIRVSWLRFTFLRPTE